MPLQFQVTLKPTQLSSKQDPETQEYLYQMTYQDQTIYPPYPQFRFFADNLEEAKTFIESNEIIELRILE